MNQFDQFSRWIVGHTMIALLWVRWFFTVMGIIIEGRTRDSIYLAGRLIQQAKFSTLQMLLNVWGWCDRRGAVRASAISERVFNSLAARWLDE